MLHTTKVLPPTVAPPTRPLSILQSIRAARRNVLELIRSWPHQPMVSGRMGARWHMVQDPGRFAAFFFSTTSRTIKIRGDAAYAALAVGDSLFTSEGDSWRWQRRVVAPVFAGAM
jgi:cytochrome P450